MRINGLNSVNYTPSAGQNRQEPAFGHVIKTRFFEVLPDGSKAQVQDKDLLKELAKRLAFHLTLPERQKKGRLPQVAKFLGDFDGDYQGMPLVRRIFNFNRYYDNCFYLITGKDADTIDAFAQTYHGADKKSRIIDKHWEMVRDKKLRIKDEDSEELALNIYLSRGEVNPKTGKPQYFISQSKGLNIVKERLMHFPYRARNENLP